MPELTLNEKHSRRSPKIIREIRDNVLQIQWHWLIVFWVVWQILIEHGLNLFSMPPFQHCSGDTIIEHHWILSTELFLLNNLLVFRQLICWNTLMVNHYRFCLIMFCKNSNKELKSKMNQQKLDIKQNRRKLKNGQMTG
jgi:hypothetical protein